MNKLDRIQTLLNAHKALVRKYAKSIAEIISEPENIERGDIVLIHGGFETIDNRDEYKVLDISKDYVVLKRGQHTIAVLKDHVCLA